MIKQDTTPDAPSHTPGTAKGEELAKDKPEELGFMARDSTSINPDKRGPIDPRMPNMPPA